MKKPIIITLMLLFPIVSILATDVYFYESSESDPIVFTDVQTIVFGDSEITVTLSDGTIDGVDISAVSYFRFYEEYRDVVDRISSSASTYGLSAVLEGSLLRATSSEQINNFSIFNVNGQKMYEINPNANNVSISMEAYQPGVYIVKSVSGDDVIVKKIIIK